MLTHQGTQTLTTNRLILRRFREDDACQMLHNWANDMRVAEFLSWNPHGNIEDTKAIIEKWVIRTEKSDHYDWGIEIDGNLIGSINIIDFSERDEWCELGYCIGYQYWNKGYMTEAVNAVVDYLFSKVNFHRIVIRNATDNPASGRVAESLPLVELRVTSFVTLLSTVVTLELTLSFATTVSIGHFDVSS